MRLASNLYKIALLPGLMALASAACFWIVLVYANPYSKSVGVDSTIITIAEMLLPACVSVLSLLLRRPLFMYVATLGAAPVGFYFALTPGVFKWYGVVPVLYFVSAALMSFDRMQERRMLEG